MAIQGEFKVKQGRWFWYQQKACIQLYCMQLPISDHWSIYTFVLSCTISEIQWLTDQKSLHTHPFEFWDDSNNCKKLNSSGSPSVKKSCSFWYNTSVWQTDRQMDISAVAISALATALVKWLKTKLNENIYFVIMVNTDARQSLNLALTVILMSATPHYSLTTTTIIIQIHIILLIIK